MRLARGFAVLMAVCALSACSSWMDSDQPHLRASTNLIPGERVVIGQKQNAYTLSKKYGVPMDDIIVLNKLRAPYTVWPGQSIALPLGAGQGGGGNIALADNSAYGTAPAYPAARSDSVSVSELEQPMFARAPGDPAITQAIGKQPMQEQIAFSVRDKFVWPLEGPVLSRYGDKSGNINNDGVNIAGPRGTPVQAAANGIVIHADNDARGFGNLVLIRHGTGFITAYAHLDRMVVDKDSVIAKGDMIGTVGNTGSVKGPQLHFEIRKNGKPVNPEPFLPAQKSQQDDMLPSVLE